MNAEIKKEKCDSCQEKEYIRQHLSANQMQAIARIICEKCEICVSGWYPRTSYDYYKEVGT